MAQILILNNVGNQELLYGANTNTKPCRKPKKYKNSQTNEHCDL